MEARISQTMRPRRLARRALRQAHRWLGLTLGLFLSAVGLSGALLVFAEQMVRAEAPQLYPAPGAAATSVSDWRPVSEWFASAEKRYPDLAPFKFAFGPGAIPMPTGVPLLFKLTEDSGEERHTLIPIDPVKGEALERVNAEDTWAGILVIFHKELLAHETGILIVAISGIVGLISVITGAYLWWPRKGRWAAAFKVRTGARGASLLYDLHSAPAAWLMLPLSVVLFTGLWIQKPTWVDPVVGALSSVGRPPAQALTSTPSRDCTTPTTVDGAVALARKGREADMLRHVLLPMGPNGVFNVEFVHPSGNSRAEGTTVYVDRHCSRVLHVEEAGERSAGETMKAWKWPLHTDLLLGWPGKIMVMLAGLLLPALMITGFWHWLATRRR